MKIRFPAAAVAAALIVALLAACSPPGNGSADAADSAAHKDDGKVTLGVVGAFSGDLSYVGNAIKAGAQYAVDVRNDQGGVLGKKISVVKCDGKFEPSTEKTCLTKLVESDHADAIVMDSPALAALEPNFLSELRVPIMIGLPFAQEMDPTRLPNAFGIESKGDSPEVLAGHLVDVLGARQIGVVASDTQVTDVALAAFKSALASRHVEPTSVQRTSVGQVDVSSEVKKVRDSGAQVLVVLALGADAARVVQAADNLSWKPQIAGTETLYMRAFRELAQSSTDGTLLTLPHAGEADSVDPAFLRWVFDYFRRYSIKPITVAGQSSPDWPGLEQPAYELTDVILRSMRSIDSTDPAKVIGQIERERPGFRPIARNIRFSVDDHLGRVDPLPETWVATFRDGHVLYSPDPRSVPALEEARVVLEQKAFEGGKTPKADVALVQSLAQGWLDQITTRKDAIVARAGQERYDTILKQAQQAAAFAGSLKPGDLGTDAAAADDAGVELRLMDFDLPASAETYRAQLRSWLDEHPNPTPVDLADAGLVAPHWPKPYGRDASPIEQIVIDQELRRAKVGRPMNIIGIGWAGPTLVYAGSDAQKERYLRPILTGEEVWCQLFSEPGAGSDLANLSTRAVRDGDEWIINGQKIWTSLAQNSKFGILLARTDVNASKQEGITYFICPMDTPGIEIRPIIEMTGQHLFNEVFLTDVRIPAENVVGEVNRGWHLGKVTLGNERVSLSGEGALWGQGPTAKNVIDLAVQGGGVAEPELRQRLAALYVEAEVLRLIRLRTVSAAIAGREPGPEASIRKALADEHGKRIMEAARALAGTAGMLMDSGGLGGRAAMFNHTIWTHGYLFAPALTIGGGTAEVQRNIIGERVLGLPKDVDVEAGKTWAEAATAPHS